MNREEVTEPPLHRGSSPTQTVCTAIIPWVPPLFEAFFSHSESGNTNCTSASDGGIAAQISFSNGSIPEERIDLDATSDDEVSTGSGFIYDDDILDDLLNDKFGLKRTETEQEKAELVGTSFVVAGQRWTVRTDIFNNHMNEEFLEMGLRSNTLDFACLPKRCRSQREVISGHRASPRTNTRINLAKRDETKAIHEIFMTLYPVNWKQSLKRLNASVVKEATVTRRKSNEVSENEYWIFVGLLLLSTVQKSGGISRLFKDDETEGIVQRVDGSEYMNFTRFKFLKKMWVNQFSLDISDDMKQTNKWWKVGYLVQGFNSNRKSTVASSRVKTLDESMSAFCPQTRKTGNLPNISYILRKPEPLGTELKTVASKGSNGPMIYAEVQEGKEGMKHKPYFNTYGATSACVLRLSKGTKDNGQLHDKDVRNLFYGDSWFASLKTAVAVKEEIDSEFLGPVKTSHKHFPKRYLEETMKDWPPGSHMVLETTVRGNNYIATGYKYNMKKVLCFISTEGAGHTMPGKPYEAKWLDDNGRMASRQIARPHMLSEYFQYSNQIDKHNHARQSELAIEKNVITEDGYFRLFCTYLGITVTDAWKLYRHGLGEKCANKNMSILAFANILCKTHLLNDYKKKHNESNPHHTLRSISSTLCSQQELVFPEQITTSATAVLSSIGTSSSKSLIKVGTGKYIPSTYQAPHQRAFCEVTETYCDAGSGSYSDKRRKRGRCQICHKKATAQCSLCKHWICNPASATNRPCFYKHQQSKIQNEREDHWHSIQDS